MKTTLNKINDFSLAKVLKNLLLLHFFKNWVIKLINNIYRRRGQWLGKHVLITLRLLLPFTDMFSF